MNRRDICAKMSVMCEGKILVVHVGEYVLHGSLPQFVAIPLEPTGKNTALLQLLDPGGAAAPCVSSEVLAVLTPTQLEALFHIGFLWLAGHSYVRVVRSAYFPTATNCTQCGFADNHLHNVEGSQEDPSKPGYDTQGRCMVCGCFSAWNRRT